jgi:hypothetical protein
MTLGQLKFRLLKQFAGLDLDVLEGFIQDRYEEILEELPWQRLEATIMLATVAPYSTGTVSVTAASNAVTLTGGAFDATMTGRAMRVAGRDEIYEFTFSTSTTGLLDRPYEGPTAAAATYKIFQAVYAMPGNCRILPDDALSSNLWPMQRLTRGQLNIAAPSRAATGSPTCWMSYMDDSSTPPRMQIELYPVPDTAMSLQVTYTAEAPAPSAGTDSFLPWMTPSTALVEGVTAKILRTTKFKDLAGAQLAMAAAEKALSTMRNSEAQRWPNTQMELPAFYTSHRLKRWCR